jgi:hypothetical protein
VSTIGNLVLILITHPPTPLIDPAWWGPTQELWVSRALPLIRQNYCSKTALISLLVGDREVSSVGDRYILEPASFTYVLMMGFAALGGGLEWFLTIVKRFGLGFSGGLVLHVVSRQHQGFVGWVCIRSVILFLLSSGLGVAISLFEQCCTRLDLHVLGIRFSCLVPCLAQHVLCLLLVQHRLVRWGRSCGPALSALESEGV